VESVRPDAGGPSDGLGRATELPMTTRRDGRTEMAVHAEATRSTCSPRDSATAAVPEHSPPPGSGEREPGPTASPRPARAAGAGTGLAVPAPPRSEREVGAAAARGRRRGQAGDDERPAAGE
jgi:hypothetical protein